jgi:hypothetical protein
MTSGREGSVATVAQHEPSSRFMAGASESPLPHWGNDRSPALGPRLPTRQGSPRCYPKWDWRGPDGAKRHRPAQKVSRQTCLFLS